MGYPSGWGKKLRGVQRFDFKFPDHAGKANSETLMVEPVSEDLFIVLKNVTRVLGRLPRTPQDSGASPGRAARSPFTHSSSAAREPRVWWGEISKKEEESFYEISHDGYGYSYGTPTGTGNPTLRTRPLHYQQLHPSCRVERSARGNAKRSLQTPGDNRPQQAWGSQSLHTIPPGIPGRPSIHRWCFSCSLCMSPMPSQS